MTRLRFAGVMVLILASALWASFGLAAGDIAVFAGQKSLKDTVQASINDDPNAATIEFDDLTEFGMVLSAGADQWPVLMAIDLLYAEDDGDLQGATADWTTWELALGVRKFWGFGNDKFRPFVGGGLLAGKVETELDAGLLTTDSDDLAPGYWLNGGFLWNFWKRTSVGVDLRYSDWEASIKQVDIETGGTHVGVLVGWEF